MWLDQRFGRLFLQLLPLFLTNKHLISLDVTIKHAASCVNVTFLMAFAHA
jgi:hypothetical protein